MAKPKRRNVRNASIWGGAVAVLSGIAAAKLAAVLGIPLEAASAILAPVGAVVGAKLGKLDPMQ